MGEATTPKRVGRRKRTNRTPAVILHEKNRILDGFILILLSFAALGSAFSLGASWDRPVSAWPFYMAMHLGLILFCLKPFFNRSYRRVLLPPGSVLAGVMILYALVHWLVLSKVPHASREELYKLFSFFGAYLAWTELAATRKRWVWILAAVLIGGSLMAWYGFIQDVKESNTVLHLSEELDWTRPEQYGNRASGAYICPNHYAQFIGMVIILASGLVVMSSSGALLRVLSLYSLPLCAYTLFLSQSRSGFLGVFAGVGATWLLLGLRRSFSFFLLALAGLLLLAGGGLYAAWNVDESFRARVEQAIQMGDIRMHIWPDTVSLIQEEPVLGSGPGTYRHTFPPHRELYNKPESTIRYAHNEYLHLTAEYGLIGMAIVGVMLFGVLVRMIRILFVSDRPRDAGLAAIFTGLVVGSMVHAIFDFHFQLFSNPHVLILICGAISGRLFVSGHFRALRVRTWGMYALAGAGIVVTLITGYWFTQTAFAASQEFLAEQYDERLLEDGDLYDQELALGAKGKKFKRYERMVKLNPGSWIGYGKLGRAWHDLGSPYLIPEAREKAFSVARENYEKALERNPYDDESLLGLALLRHEMGASEEAYGMMDTLLAMEPFHPDYVFHYGMMLKEDGKWGEALKVFEGAEQKLQLEDENAIRAFQANLEQCRLMIQRGGAVQSPAPRPRPLNIPPPPPEPGPVPAPPPEPVVVPLPTPKPDRPEETAPEAPQVLPQFPPAPPVPPVGAPLQPLSGTPVLDVGPLSGSLEP